MATIINHYIDLTKVDKSRLKDGKLLLVTTAVNDETKFGNNVGTYETPTKEEREAKKKRNYIGNGKVVWTDGAIAVAEKEETVASSNGAAPPAEDLPF
tara:strand:+ start:27 stop:320 length:294 start_codon:yes stop_codon:yes gene_type:complete